MSLSQWACQQQSCFASVEVLSEQKSETAALRSGANSRLFFFFSFFFPVSDHNTAHLQSHRSLCRHQSKTSAGPAAISCRCNPRRTTPVAMIQRTLRLSKRGSSLCLSFRSSPGLHPSRREPTQQGWGFKRGSGKLNRFDSRVMGLGGSRRGVGWGGGGGGGCVSLTRH